jgi:aryl-alcohol dehydrogenase-like predicted oxidoreductase
MSASLAPACATQEGTARYASRFPAHAEAGFFRTAQRLTVSSLGMGTYLGNLDEATDQAYTEAAMSALRGGINFIDTSLNYRHQRSERSLGEAFRRLRSAGEIARDEFVICTKAGYLVPCAIPAEKLASEDIAGGAHAIAPGFLADQLDRSLENLGVPAIDVFYLHNPESQFDDVSTSEVYRRIRKAFEQLEREAADGRIRYYGAATWTAFRTREGSGDGLSVMKMAEIAHSVAGEAHRFRFIQLPFNLAMTEGATSVRESLDGRRMSSVAAARELDISVVASASILQGRLSRELPNQAVESLPGLATDAQRAIQFARSAPGITVALAGMSRISHVKENLRVSYVQPADLTQWFRRSR